MHSGNNVARFASITAALLLSTSAFGQSTNTSSQLYRPSGIGGPVVNESILNPTEPMVRSISDPPNGSASSFGQAEFGVLKASATANADAELYGAFYARSVAAFYDDFAFSSPGLAGTSGFMIVTLDFDRTLGVTGNTVDSYATASLHAGTNFWAYDYIETYMLQPSGCNPYVTSPCALNLTAQTGNGADSATWLDANTVSLKVPITFSQPNSFSVSVDMAALARFYSPDGVTGGPATWVADAANSLYWGGISSVTDASGNSVAFDLSTASGTNYLESLAPVPEPATYALLLVGLGALGLRRRQ